MTTNPANPTNLLPCPLCGGQAVGPCHRTTSHWPNGESVFEWVFVGCESCGAETAINADQGNAAVIARWNRRAPLSVPAEREDLYDTANDAFNDAYDGAPDGGGIRAALRHVVDCVVAELPSHGPVVFPNPGEPVVNEATRWKGHPQGGLIPVDGKAAAYIEQYRLSGQLHMELVWDEGERDDREYVPLYREARTVLDTRPLVAIRSVIDHMRATNADSVHVSVVEGWIVRLMDATNYWWRRP